MSRSTPLLVAICSLLVSACAHRPADRIEDLLANALRAAENHHEFDLDPEAAVLLHAMRGVDPDFPGTAELYGDLDLDAIVGLDRGLLGMNRKLRPDIEREVWQQVVLWIPDRVLDLLDIVSFDVHMGWGVFADAHATRAMQLVGGARVTGGIGLHDHRSLGMKSQGEAGFNVAILGAHSYAGGLVGTSGAQAAISNSAGWHEPTDPLYRSLRDYWAFGASATAAIIGAEVEIHPVQIADFVAGWIGIDFLNDDFAHTRALRLEMAERQMIAELWKIQDNQALLDEYVAARQRGELSNPPVPPRPSEPSSAPLPDSRTPPSDRQRLQRPASMAP